jgi:hypothetical protein
MAKKKVKVEKKHKHVWKVKIEYDRPYCDCIDNCNCESPANVHAICKCGVSLDEWEIADKLNGK